MPIKNKKKHVEIFLCELRQKSRKEWNTYKLYFHSPATDKTGL